MISAPGSASLGYAGGASASQVNRSAAARRRSTVGGLFALLLWSLTVALGRSLAESIGPLTAGAAIYSSSGLVCFGYLLMRPVRIRRILRMSPRYLIGCGLLFVVYTVAVYLAIGMAADGNQVLEIGLVNYLWPALTMVLSLPLLGKRASLGLLPATAVALCGIFVVLTGGTSVSWSSFSANVLRNPWAYSLGLAAAISWAFYSNLVDRWTRAEDNDRNSSGVLFFIPITGLAMLLIGYLSNEESTWTPRAGLEVAAMAVATIFGYYFWEAAMRNGNQVLVKACAYFLPFFSTVVACLYLRVTPGLSLWAGCALLIIGSLWSWHSVADDPNPKARSAGSYQ